MAQEIKNAHQIHHFLAKTKSGIAIKNKERITVVTQYVGVPLDQSGLG
jgi:hypothetical protein